MSALDIAAEFIPIVEGFSSTVYQDSKGVFTIGCGTTRINGNPVTADTPACTREQAQAWLEVDMVMAYTGVENSVYAPANDNQIAAFISFAYNEGVSAFRGSTLLAKFNAGDLEGCEAQFADWVYISKNGSLVKLQGLVNRRNAELNLFKNGLSAVQANLPVPTVLKLGDKSAAVAKLQLALLGAGYYKSGVDGDFGPDTLKAVEAFQIANGLTVDGVAGQETMNSLLNT